MALVVLTPGQRWSWIWQVLCHQGPLKWEEDRESVRSWGGRCSHTLKGAWQCRICSAGPLLPLGYGACAGGLAESTHS